jgi:hypothetical protein
MKKLFICILLTVYSSLLFGQSELTRIKSEPMWYECEGQYESYNLIFSPASSELSKRAEASKRGYDGVAIFTRYDVITDKEATLDLFYWIDKTNSRVCLYMKSGVMPFYVKFRNGQACVYALDEETGDYTLLTFLEYFDVQSYL